MEELIVVFRNIEQHNHSFCEFVTHLQTSKLWPFRDAFQQHNPNQTNHGSTYLTSLMAHV